MHAGRLLRRSFIVVLLAAALAASGIRAGGSAEVNSLDQIVAPGTKPQVLGTGYGFCEGPTADAQGNVYFSDGKHNSIYFYEVGKPVVRFVDDSTDANGQKFNSRGELYTCEGSAHHVVAFNVATKTKRVLCAEFDGKRLNEPNDLTIDSHDGFYFTDPCYGHFGNKPVRKEVVYYCSAEGKVTEASSVCKNPNGIQLLPDEKSIYLCDCRGQRVYKCDVLAPGKLANPRPLVEVGGNPDGMTLDEQGNLYLGCGPAGVKVFSADGHAIGVIKAPYASNVCFGGPDFSTLFITASDKFLGVATKVHGLKPLELRVQAGK